MGGSGNYLWEQLGKIGVRREQCYVTNVIKKRVIIRDENEAKQKQLVPAEELAKWHAVLMRELSQLSHARFILLCGNAALTAVTGHKGIKKWRGSVLNFTKAMGYQNDGQILITYNPAFVLRDPTTEIHFRIDVARFKRVIDGTYRPHKIDAIINPSKRDILDFLRKLKSDRLPTAFDIEVMGGETSCIGFANDPHVGMCINFREYEATSRFSLHDEAEIRIAIQELFNDPNLFTVAQNGNFDSYWLRYKDRIKARVDFDTLLAHHTLLPTLPHSLAFLTTQYTEHPYYKDDITTWRDVGDINQYWRYNVTDCCITRAVYRPLHDELRREKLDQFFFNHVMRLQPHLVEMTTNGVLIDVGLKDTLAKQLTQDLDALERTFLDKAQVAAGDPNLIINPRSPTQLRDLFFNRLGLVGRGHSTDDDNRNRFRLHPNTSQASKEMLDALGSYKEEHKFLTTYVETAIDPDGRMRSEYRQWGTQSAPGRLSSSAVMWGSGGNLQNQPVRARPMFCAPPGYGFVYFDLSQAEARYVAVAWDIKALQENFRLALADPDKYDIHRLNAARIFQLPYDDIPKVDVDPITGKYTLRYKGKRCVHGLNYRMQADKLATVTNIPYVEAVHAYRLYHSAFTEVQHAWSELVSRAKRDKVLYNAFGRRWILLQRVDTDEALESIVAFEPQSSIGDKVCQVIYQSHEDPEWPRSSNGLEAAVTLNIHDALIALARLEDMRTVASIMHKYATQPLIVRGQELSIPADVALSEADDQGIHRWSTLKKVKL